MPDNLNLDLPSGVRMPPPVQPDGEGPRSNDHARSPTPDTASTASEGVDLDQRDNRFYIPFDLRIFHPNTLFTTHESLERERAGTSANAVDPSEELRQALELERWVCYWLSMRLRDAEHRKSELQEANARLRKRIEESQRDCEALREQLNTIAIEIERTGITNSSFSLLRGVLRSRMVGRVSRAIRRAPSPLANPEMHPKRG